MIRILLDPGHAWNGNAYALQPGHYEGTQMWYLANYLMAGLKSKGFYVETTRPKLKDFHDVSIRGKMAKGFDLVVSLHTNAPGKSADGTYNPKTTGTVVIRTIETPAIKPLGDDIAERVSNLMGHYSRGTIVMESKTKGRNHNSVLRNAMAVGCKAGLLIEHGFHTNPKDCAFLVNNENLKKLAIAEAEAIANFYNNGKKEGELMLTRTLRHGDSGDDVKLVQEFLKARGYYTGPIDGKFGPGQGFFNAVVAFQKAENLENPNGNIGPITRQRIVEMMIEPKPVGNPEKEKLLQDELDIQKREVEKQKVEVKRLQDELAYALNESRKYKDYFRLQEEIRRGIELL